MRRTFLLVASVAVAMLLATLYGCSQASSPVEKQEKDGVEQAAKEDQPTDPAGEPIVTKKDMKEEGTPDPTGDKQITLEELNKMSDDEAVALGNCQSAKLVEKYGVKGAEEYSDDYVKNVVMPAKGDFPSFQEYMLRDGISCSWNEISTMASAPPSGRPSAAATAEPFSESVPVAIQAEMAYCDMRQYAKKEGLNFREVEVEARTYMVEEGASWPETLEHVGVPHYVYCDMTGE